GGHPAGRLRRQHRGQRRPGAPGGRGRPARHDRRAHRRRDDDLPEAGRRTGQATGGRRPRAVRRPVPVTRPTAPRGAARGAASRAAAARGAAGPPAGGGAGPRGRCREWRPGWAVDLRATLGPLSRGTDPTCRVAAGRWWRAGNTPDGPATLALHLADGVVHAEAWGPGAVWTLVGVPDL